MIFLQVYMFSNSLTINNLNLLIIVRILFLIRI